MAEVRSLDGAVVDLGVRNLADVVSMMRSVADAIEKGELGPYRCALFIPIKADSQRPGSVFAWGGINWLESLGILAAAQEALLNPED